MLRRQTLLSPSQVSKVVTVSCGKLPCVLGVLVSLVLLANQPQVAVHAVEDAGYTQSKRKATYSGGSTGLPYKVPPRQDTCSRQLSRIASSAVQDSMKQVPGYEAYDWPQACPFKPGADVFAHQEASKKRVRASHWKCLLCGKVFKSEQYLDEHFNNRHPDSVHVDSNVCLADYCDLLECDVSKVEGGEADDTLKEALALMHEQCNDRTQSRRRNDCEVLVDLCFPPHTSSLASQLHDVFQTKYCEHFRCGGRLSRIIDKAKSLSGTRLIFSLICVMLLIIFYVGLWLYRREMQTRGDIQGLSSKRRSQRRAWLKQKTS